MIAWRTCLGIDMAYLEMKIMVVLMLRKFNFVLCKGVTNAYRRTLTLPMVDLRMGFTKRTNKGASAQSA